MKFMYTMYALVHAYYVWHCMASLEMFLLPSGIVWNYSDGIIVLQEWKRLMCFSAIYLSLSDALSGSRVMIPSLQYITPLTVQY